MPDTDSDPLNAALWSDWNHDGTNHDTDGDEDGVPNDEDSHPFDPALSTDWNFDGDDNAEDRDEDGHANEFNGQESQDSHPRDPSLWSDWDGNGTNNDEDMDGDGVLNADDSHPRHAALWSDWDFNQINNDQDGDEDGVIDSQDSDPRNNTLSRDWNHDGDDNESDWDEDGYDNGNDSHPTNANLWDDFDGDGINAADDSHSQDGSLWSDWNHDGDNHATDGDEDGVPNMDDSDPRDPALWGDWNRNGINDLDEFTQPPDPDDDGDGITNMNDAWPNDPYNNADSDGDGLSDYDEVTTHGTDRLDVDSDDDFLSDYEELLVTHTDPTAAKTDPAQSVVDGYLHLGQDTDGDGLPDLLEDHHAGLGHGLNRNDPADAAGDLDGDGVTNLQAYHQGWNLIGNLDVYDLDGDRILDAVEDAWEAAHPGSLNKNVFADAVADFDNDGVMNFEEIALGLDLAAADSGRADGLTDAQVLAWGLLSGGALTPSTDVVRQAWEQIDAAWIEYQTGSGSGYEHWLVQADVDNDGTPDGLTAFRAEFWGPYEVWRYDLTDCDGDGMSDVWEHRHQFNLRDWQDWADDPDGDGLGNLSEFQFGTHPRISDTDGDGTSDGNELAAGTDPNSPGNNPASLPLVLYAVSGGSQTALPGQTLAAPLVVQAMRGGLPVTGETVTFSAPAGSFGATTVITGADGQASTTYTVAAQPVLWEVPLSATAAGGTTTLTVHIQDVDSDDDGWADRLEQQQGGDAANAAATPVTQNPALAVALRSYDTDSMRASDYWWWSEGAAPLEPDTRFHVVHYWDCLDEVGVEGNFQPSAPQQSPLRSYPLEAALTSEEPWQAVSRDSFAFAGSVFGVYWMDTINGYVPRYGAPNHTWIPTFSRCNYSENREFLNLEEGGNGWGVAWNRVRLSLPGPLPQDYEENYLQVTKRWNRDNFDEPPTVVDVTPVKMTLRKGQTKGDWLYLTPVSLDDEILTVSLLPVDLDALEPDESISDPLNYPALPEGEAAGVVLNFDDDDNDADSSLQPDSEDSQVDGENDLLPVKLHKLDISGQSVSFKLKYDSQYLKVWKQPNKTEAVTADSTELDGTQDRVVWVEGIKVTPAFNSDETGNEITQRVKMGSGSWSDGDKLKVHVASPIFAGFGDCDPPYLLAATGPTPIPTYFGEVGDAPGDAELRIWLDAQVAAKKAKKKALSKDWIVDGIDLTTKKARKYGVTMSIKEGSSEKKIKMSLMTQDADVCFNGHANFGIGPAFKKPLATLDKFTNFSGRGECAIHPGYMAAGQGHPGFTLPAGQIMAAPFNYPVPGLGMLRYANNEGKGAGQAFVPFVVGGQTFHFTAPEFGNIPMVVVNSTNADVPQPLKYRSFFYDSCYSGRNYGESFAHGMFIYSVFGTGDKFSVQRFVAGVVNGETWNVITTDLNTMGVGDNPDLFTPPYRNKQF